MVLFVYIYEHLVVGMKWFAEFQVSYVNLYIFTARVASNVNKCSLLTNAAKVRETQPEFFLFFFFFF